MLPELSDIFPSLRPVSSGELRPSPARPIHVSSYRLLVKVPLCPALSQQAQDVCIKGGLSLVVI